MSLQRVDAAGRDETSSMPTLARSADPDARCASRTNCSGGVSG
jgi:hypothetical protein